VRLLRSKGGRRTGNKGVNGTPQASRPRQLFWICWFDLASPATYFATPSPGSVAFFTIAEYRA